MLDLNKPFAIVSSDRPGLSNHELKRRRGFLEGMAEANGYHVTAVQGVWQGEKEQSFIIHGSPNKTGHPLAEYCKMLRVAFNQDAVILFDGSLGHLITAEGSEVIGAPVPANETEDRTILPSGESFKFA